MYKTFSHAGYEARNSGADDDRIRRKIDIVDVSDTPMLTVDPGTSHNISEEDDDGVDDGVKNFDYAITLAADPPIIENVTIRCRASDIGSAKAGLDFTEVDETLTFEPGDFTGGATSVAKTCTVPIIDDDLDENQDQTSLHRSNVFEPCFARFARFGGSSQGQFWLILRKAGSRHLGPLMQDPTSQKFIKKLKKYKKCRDQKQVIPLPM